MTSQQDEIRWSKWLESMRKDVECTFGIMKGRWRILKAGVRLWGVLSVDEVWLTCCALHNWLLDVDGFGGVWNGGVNISDWAGPNGDHDYDGLNQQIPNALSRLCRNLDPRNYDSSGMGRGTDVLRDNMVDNHRVSNLVTNNISSMTLTAFRSRLVAHHAVQFRTNKLVWPRAYNNN